MSDCERSEDGRRVLSSSIARNGTFHRLALIEKKRVGGSFHSNNQFSIKRHTPTDPSITHHRSLTMKTLVVLFALAAVALAAPTLLEQGSEDFKKVINVPETFKRERKSPLESSHFEPAPGAPVGLPSIPHISEFGVSGRSFGLKKPIIIKKKPVGYQVYRDSDEVPADSGETCGSQVKVKFCDSKSKLKSSTIEDTNPQLMEEDMKHSITIAKEAIDNLQRDLKTVEGKPGTKASSWSHGNSEADAELHQDIEVAREALEHIHKSFGNFKPISLDATTLKEAEVVPEVPFTNAKTEELRLAQWKEAMDTIQKNVEIAKNIEDSFRTTPDGVTGLLVSDDMMIQDNKHELNKKLDHNLRTPQDVATKSENCKAEHVHEKSNENENANNGLIEDDMASSASTISEKNMKETETRQTSTDTKPDQSLKIEKSLEVTPQEKNADIDTIALNDLSMKSVVSDNMKTAEDNKEEEVKKIELAEGVHGIIVPTNGMKSVESEDMLVENLKKAAVSTESLEKIETEPEKHHEIKKSAEHFDEQHNKNKKEDHIQTDLHTEQSQPIKAMMFAKSAEEVTNLQQEILAEPKLQKTVMINGADKHFAEAKNAKNEDLKTQQEILASVNEAEPMELQHQPMFHPEMRATEDMKNMHQQLMMDPHTRWAEDKNMHLQRESMTAANGMHSHMVQHPGHHHHVTHGMKNHHFEVPSGFQSRFPEHFMTQEKSADPEMQAYYMSMRDGSGLAPENHRFRWKPAHEAPRTAYGPPAAPSASPQSGGALGVFPNANIGSCGIPLLLSCNPSVVSGNLAKPTPVPYSAPAYRTEDDFNFLTKRDVKITHDNLRTPKANLKTSTVLVAKQ